MYLDIALFTRYYPTRNCPTNWGTHRSCKLAFVGTFATVIAVAVGYDDAIK